MLFFIIYFIIIIILPRMFSAEDTEQLYHERNQRGFWWLTK